MRKLLMSMLVAALAMPQVVFAQEQLGEIIVTAQRATGEYYSDGQPVIGLRRQADSAVQDISINSDSRDELTRKREIHAMILSALDRAANAGVQLVTGNFELVTVTKANYNDLEFKAGKRPDTSQIDLMVKAKLEGSTGTAQKRIDDFIRDVPATGRALIDKNGELTLTIINPDQYRDQVLKLVAEGALHHAGFFGPDYGVEVSGLGEPLAWSQASNTEVFLYVPYRFIVKRK